ncbi:MAG: GYDIA family GHMP kinase [Bacteroidota bacterium]
MKQYRSHGKLLLTAEYLVLDGAKALALTTQFGQSLTVTENDSNIIKWNSYDEHQNEWFSCELNVKNANIHSLKSTDDTVSERLIQILNAAKQLNPSFLTSNCGYTINTKMDFNRHWGLGTSSTLVNNIANWAIVDAYTLLESTFGGSGYDIACAQHNHPITYQITGPNQREVREAAFNPSFKEYLYFVYLNKKQNSREGIKAYKANKGSKIDTIEAISTITDNIINCKSLKDFDELINTHETLIASVIDMAPIKEALFSDFEGSVKSLGAWGGDFILATSTENPQSYFNRLGFDTIFPYSKMVF